MVYDGTEDSLRPYRKSYGYHTKQKKIMHFFNFLTYTY
jgi:hypothetical protein